MAIFILDIVIVLCLGGILFLFARVLPRISNETLNSSNSDSRTQWIVTYVEKSDEWVKIFSEKLLRRVKVIILKFDNTVSRRLNKFREEPQKETKLGEGGEVFISPESEEKE